MPNFVEIALTVAEISLNFSTVGTVKGVKQHHYAKCRRNRSKRGRDMAIFRFFKMAAVRQYKCDKLDQPNYKLLRIDLTIIAFVQQE